MTCRTPELPFPKRDLSTTTSTGPSGTTAAAATARTTRDRTGRGSRGPWRRTCASPARGPKNYVRPDARIFEDVCEMLTDHGDLDASEIEVTVDDGDVILRGTVRSRWAKYYAEDLAMAAGGVRDVVNELRIARNPNGSEVGGPTTDTGGGLLPKLHMP